METESIFWLAYNYVTNVTLIVITFIYVAFAKNKHSRNAFENELPSAVEHDSNTSLACPSLEHHLHSMESQKYVSHLSAGFTL